MAKQHDKQFKPDAVQYCEDHKNPGVRGCAKNSVYPGVSEKTEAAKKAGRRVSVSGMLKFSGASRSGCHARLRHVPSDTEKRRRAVKTKIQDIYDDSRQDCGAPKITAGLHKTGEVIPERTAGIYIRQMGIRAQWNRPWTVTAKDSGFSTELQNILDEQFHPDCPDAVWCSDTTCIWTAGGSVWPVLWIYFPER